MLIRPYQMFVRQDPPQSGRLANNTAVNSLLSGSETIVSRRLCTFSSKIFAAERISRDLINAVILEAVALAERPKPGLFIQVSGRVVNCWTWDADQIGALSERPARQAVPETVYHRPANGVALRKCLEGCEGQMWSGGVLRMSRWWAQPPSEEDWAHFCRAAGKGDPSGAPKIEQGFDPKTVRSRNRLTAANMLRQIRPTEYLAAAAALALLPAAYFGMRNAVIEADMMRTAAVHAELSVETQEKRAVVRELTRVNAALASIQDAMVTTAPLPAIASAIETVGSVGGTLEGVTLSGEELRLTFNSASPFSERTLVEALEAAPTLRQASVSKEGQTSRWVIVARMERDG